jgi:L-glyceraldehyde 3-phosphate reductase
MGALAHAVHTGKALYAGISNYDADGTARAARLLREMGAPCLIHQPKYSMFERWIEGGLLDVLKREGIGCIAFSPLAQGLLTEKYLRGIPEGSRASKPHGFLRPEQVTADKISQVKKLNELAGARGQTLAQFALAWVLRHAGMTSVLIGASSVGQIEENLKAPGRATFSADELRAIGAIVSARSPAPSP